MSTISHFCDSIVKQLTTLGRNTASSLLPGITESEIRKHTSELPFALPLSAIELYKWSEGQDPARGTGTELFPGFGMGTLAEMVEIYHELSKDEEFPRFHSGCRRWFPLFQNESTDYYGIFCSNDEIADCEIVDDSNEGEHRDNVTLPQVVFVSLEAMLKTILVAYEQGVYYVNEAGALDVGVYRYDNAGQILDIDLSEFKAIASKLNPGLKVWE